MRLGLSRARRAHAELIIGRDQLAAAAARTCKGIARRSSISCKGICVRQCSSYLASAWAEDCCLIARASHEVPIQLMRLTANFSSKQLPRCVKCSCKTDNMVS